MEILRIQADMVLHYDKNSFIGLVQGRAWTNIQIKLLGNFFYGKGVLSGKLL
jgi:hypothetical protein